MTSLRWTGVAPVCLCPPPTPPSCSSGFHEKDGKAYCRKDYFDMFAPKCGGCARAILENYISALNTLWHPECFVCRVRGASILPEAHVRAQSGQGWVAVCFFKSKSSAGVEMRD